MVAGIIFTAERAVAMIFGRWCFLSSAAALWGFVWSWPTFMWELCGGRLLCGNYVAIMWWLLCSCGLLCGGRLLCGDYVATMWGPTFMWELCGYYVGAGFHVGTMWLLCGGYYVLMGYVGVMWSLLSEIRDQWQPGRFRWLFHDACRRVVGGEERRAATVFPKQVCSDDYLLRRADEYNSSNAG